MFIIGKINIFLFDGVNFGVVHPYFLRPRLLYEIVVIYLWLVIDGHECPQLLVCLLSDVVSLHFEAYGFLSVVIALLGGH